MKCCLFVFLFISLGVSAQNKTDTTHKQLVTAIPKPFGDVTSAKIDNKGGRIKSADTNLEIIVPENALDTETTISIQATHNELNENDEGAYQLEPSGMQFKKPVQLIFHCKDESAELKSIAWQDAQGQWHRLKKIITDTIQRTVSCFTSHFSSWANFNKLYLDPKSGTVKVGKSIFLLVREYGLNNSNPTSDDDLLETPTIESGDNALLAVPYHYPFYTSNWTVNGTVNGDPEDGTLQLVESTNSHGAYYKAPAVVPEKNPVTVSVQIYSNNTNKKLLLTSNITVIGNQYHFTYIHIDENGCYFLVDSSSCIINLQKDKVSISNIINYKPWSDWPQCDKPCRDEWTNKESLKGAVEITGVASSSVIVPKEGNGLPNVNIVFSPAMGNTPSEIIHCKDGDRPIPSMLRTADPRTINFDIDGDEVIIHYAGKTSKNELVLPAKNEKTMIYIYKLSN